MKNFQQNLLIGLALALCCLCVYQWYEQTFQRKEIATLNQTVFDKSVAIQDCTNSIATMNHQIVQMDARITELKEIAKTNEQLLVDQKRELARLQFISESLTNEITEYKNAVDTLNVKLKEAYEGINKQNESLKDLVAQRDEFVKKYNDSVKDRNDIVARYNQLAEQVKKLQGDGKQ
jgi:chromosome segregation ATPase